MVNDKQFAVLTVRKVLRREPAFGNSNRIPSEIQTAPKTAMEQRGKVSAFNQPNRALLTIEVGIVETNDERRRYQSALVSGTPGMRTVWACATAREALESLHRSCPRVVLVSLFLSDMTGTELVKKLRGACPTVLPILMIPENQSLRAVETLEAGACGYLHGRCPADELIRAVWTVHEGGAILEQPVAKTIVEYFRARGLVIDRLTAREREVLICLSEGLSQQDVVVKLGISKETVRTHVRNVLGKLGARSTMQAVAFYLNPKTPASKDARRSNGKLENARSIPGGNICVFPSQVGAPAAP
jgi:DNA-binding NarL/FixJ family response regulator